MFVIQKEFNFSYSHRVHNQELREELSLDCNLGCTGPHGHNGRIVVFCKSQELDHKGMVIDFKELAFVGKFIDDNLDHKCILDLNDPSLQLFYPILSRLNINDGESIDSHLEYLEDGYFIIWTDLYSSLSKCEIEIYRALVFTNFVPTSENLAKWLFEIVQSKLEGYAVVEKVEFWETPKSCSTYYGK